MTVPCVRGIVSCACPDNWYAATTMPAARHDASKTRQHDANDFFIVVFAGGTVGALQPVLLRFPLQPELARRRPVADEGRRGDHGRARQVAFAAEAHAVLPVAVEGRDRAL